MITMKRELLVSLSIPIVFIIGIMAFVFLSSQPITITDFVGYMSSLSTIVMILVYFLTTSRQLSAMRSQLAEMQYSRNVQSQPLLYFEETEAHFKLPHYYVSPTTNFLKMKMQCQIHFRAKAVNIGNSPAVAVDFIPKLLSDRDETILDMSLGERLECISLKGGDSKSVLLVFHDSQNRVAEALLKDRVVFLDLTVIYKNVLGMPFKQQMGFVLRIQEIDEENLKLCLKTTRTAEIDFAKKVEEYKSLAKIKNLEGALKILRQVNSDLKKRFGDKDKMNILSEIKSGSFSISPISELEYKQIIATKEEMQKKVLAPWGEVPWFLAGSGNGRLPSHEKQ